MKIDGYDCGSACPAEYSYFSWDNTCYYYCPYGTVERSGSCLVSGTACPDG